MAVSGRYTALLDACVLYAVPVVDSLLTIKETGLFVARWTRDLEAEAQRALQREHPSIPAERFEARFQAMRAATSDWEVEEGTYGPLVAGLRPALPDGDDAHVLAAAIAGNCDCIVTFNLKDFPAGVLQPYGLEAIHPDDFLVYQLDLNPAAVLTGFKVQRARLRNPPRSAEEFVAAFERNQLTSTAARLREAIALI